MAKRYDKPSDDLLKTIAQVRNQFYPDLESVEVGALFMSDGSGKPCLTHQGYQAAGLCRIVPGRDRAAGMPDAQIIIDAVTWAGLTAKQKRALIDHELMHIEIDVDEETGIVKCDAQDRPALKIRKHDRQFGWFDQVAHRHGEHSMEVRQARDLVAEAAQLYFDFEGNREAA